MNFRPDENLLKGEWIQSGSTVVPDETCKRIDHLVTNVLEKVAESPTWGAWEILYRDPFGGRLWERTFPKGEVHGGGPPQLSYISHEQAKEKYGIG